MTLVLFMMPAVAAGLLAYLLTPLAGRVAVWVGALDQPGPRKIHKQPVPRLGGLAVIAAVAIVGGTVSWLLPWIRLTLAGGLRLGIALGVLPIVAVSIYDDIKPLPAGLKFVAHLVGASMAVALGVSLNPALHLFGQSLAIGWLAYPLSVLWLVGTTNAFNLIDGLDGLCAGLGLISAFALCAVFAIAGQPYMAGAALIVAGALIGFLPFNMYPARMFFGDTGATAIGFCLAAFALRGGSTLSAGFAALLPVFVLGLPITETLMSMARRTLRRLDTPDAGGVFDPDRNHMHHRLLALGIDHPRAVLILYGAGMVLAAVALVSMFMTAKDSALLLIALLLTGVLGVQRLGYDEFAFIRNGLALRMYDAPTMNKSMFAVFADVVLVAVSAAFAVALKTEDWHLVMSRELTLAMVTTLAPTTVCVFWRLHIYRGTWRLAGVEEFVRVCCGVLVAALIGMIAQMVMAPEEPTLSLFSIYSLVAIVLITGSRASYQVIASSHWRAATGGTPTLVYGAGRKGVTAVREMIADRAGALRPVAFIDDNPDKAGRVLNGMPIVGPLQSLDLAIRRFAARSIVVASDAISESRLALLGEECERLGVALLRLQVSFDRVTAEPSLALPIPAAIAVAVPAVAETQEPVGQRLMLATEPADREKPEPAPLTFPNIRFEELCVPGTRVPLVVAERCPSCSSHAFHRSHARTAAERLRKKLTNKRLFRCDACGWRGWTYVIDNAVSGDAGRQLPPLEPVDAVLRHTPTSQLAN